MTKPTGQPVGRPSKRDERLIEKIKHALMLGRSFDNSARFAGIHQSTFFKWRRDDPEFAMECEKWRAEGQNMVLGKVMKAISRGDMQSARWWLSRTCEEFRDKQEVSVGVSGDEVRRFQDSIDEIRRSNDPESRPQRNRNGTDE
jgi:hypothetical protein